MIEFNSKRILVLGLQKSGKAATRLLKTLNVEIFVSDEKKLSEEDIEFFKGTTIVEYTELSNILESIDIIVKSPGIKFDIDILKQARLKNVQVISEIELAYHFIDKNNKVIVGITGTNGKTTSTSLITKILQDSNVEAISVGNIGYTLSDAILDKLDVDVYVVELSSFQLQDIVDFRPHIGILLNLSEAHIDYHNTYDNYIDAKMNLFKNMTSEDCLIYNIDDKLIRKRVKKAKCLKYSFSLKESNADCYIQDNIVMFNGRKIMPTSDLKLPGEHNLYNVLACVTAARVFYIENENFINTLENFESLPHRIQYVGNFNGVMYYNDSKSSNETSTLCALNSFSKDVILILGGYERHQDYSTIIKNKTVKYIIAFGQTKERILSDSVKYNKKCSVCHDLLEVVKLAKKLAVPDDIVLFSPASASWDQFKDYEERGDKFIEYLKSDTL